MNGRRLSFWQWLSPIRAILAFCEWLMAEKSGHVNAVSVTEHVLNERLVKERDDVPSAAPFIINYYGNVHVNTVNVSHSQVGAVNAGGSIGSIGDIQITVGALKEQGKATLADALSLLTTALSECGLSEREKSDLLQNMKLLSDEAAKSDDQKNFSLVKFFLDHFDKVLPTIEGVAKVWDSCRETVCSLGN
ncbi:hypothetical protein [Burkholderia gladioli]|uniref:hypothetical protein n=1 Tax=Burkholderia gladioli TaxID=28095 RepID=UPI001C258029|nr:hypothetical protein [Burkholderia gladioli]MBU9380550.1 hypothetical protein [Burkholderia gladioli]